MANKNKVYVNPNFNRLISSSVPPMAIANNKIIMHVNPNFSQQVLSNTKKIYVNPNFLSTNVQSGSNQTTLNRATLTYEPTDPVAVKPDLVSTETPKSRSRYSLIRQNTNKFTLKNAMDRCTTTSMKINKYKYVSTNNYTNNLEPITKPIEGTETRRTTVKINKYKSVAITKLRKNLEFPSGLSNIKLNDRPITYKSNASSSKNTSYTQKSPRSNYKFCKPNSLVRLDKAPKLSSSPLIPLRYKNIKLKMTKKCLKKNNIPCPLYRKYGKCLRSIKGTCEFLHDKKHVSICRKFLKGLCRDENCLLSHDVSTNKMPTCSFYLKGMCTKNNCPYLHVKLNDKSKLCLDFLKGYCEKGDLCLNRHVHVNSHKQSKLLANHSISSKALMKPKNTNSNTTNKKEHVNIKSIKRVKEQQKPTSGEPNTNESRYYNDVMIKLDSETNEVIKPTRCKLGALPSFIKF